MKRLFAVFLILCMSIMVMSCGTTNTPPSQEQETKQEANTAVETILGAGTFYVGEDIPAGRYVITPGEKVSESRRGIIEVYNEGEDDYDMSEMLDPTGKIGVSAITYDLIGGQKIIISSMDEVLFTPKN